MSNLEFVWPYAALLFLLALALWLMERKRERRQRFLKAPMAQAIKPLLQKNELISGRKIEWFFLFFFAFLVIALMRPRLVGEPIEISREGRNVMLVVDLSESMEAADMSLNQRPVDRLTAAKDVLSTFIDKRRGDRIGLVVFGSEAFLHAPLSFDLPVIKQFLDDAQIGFAGPKTAIGDAIGLATKKLMELSKGDRLMILLTDGQNNAGALEPLQAAAIAQKHQVKIYTVGLGASRMVVDGFFGQQAINPSAALDESEPELKRIAESSGGKYFRARDHGGLEQIYTDIDALEPVKADPIVIIPHKEVFFWPLVAAMVMLVIRYLQSLMTRRFEKREI